MKQLKVLAVEQESGLNIWSFDGIFGLGVDFKLAKSSENRDFYENQTNFVHVFKQNNFNLEVE